MIWGVGKDLLNRVQKAIIKKKDNVAKLDNVEIKNICSSEDITESKKAMHEVGIYIYNA